MEEITLSSERREPSTKGAMKKLRASGKIPAILYGPEITNSIPLSVNKKDFVKLLHVTHGGSIPIILNLEDTQKYKVIIRDIQYHPLTNEILHVDFYAFPLKKEVEVNIPVRIVGEAPGVEHGGRLEILLREVKIKCLAENIPQYIDVDVSKLELKGMIFVKDLPVDKNIKILSNPEQIIVHCIPPHAAPTPAAETAPEGAGAAAGATATTTEAAKQPEVIKKGKKEEVEEAEK
jgi:large subunit ribosomal protein L25